MTSKRSDVTPRESSPKLMNNGDHAITIKAASECERGLGRVVAGDKARGGRGREAVGSFDAVW